ncbi:CHAD domain-containing protein [Ruegeria meonggei]|uniref:CHAD domain protein n=1 Tax=Ruegeria meonggei TaxID=1446476 RepID=A0A1X6YQ81_9RHOB|nr:CHAD domain-containing protein [Ruegeria meonggei]SLN27440.1 CHAD domain protein [Ruegeria meonggei]
MANDDGFFVFSGRFDLTQVSKGLKGFSLKIENSIPRRAFNLLDCYDQSVRAGGRLLIQTDDVLRLLNSDGSVVEQSGIGTGRFVQDLPEGPVRTALTGFSSLRALMGITSGWFESHDFAVLDDLQKTQVRGFAQSLSTQGGQVVLVCVQPMRGYDRAFQTVRAAFADLSSGQQSMEAVFQALLPGISPYKAKPDIALGTDEPSVQVATDIIRTYLHVARQNEAGVIADIDTEFLHDYRVSLRRIRSVLSLFKGVFSPDQTAEFKQVFSDLMAPTGPVRDMDVYLLDKDMYFSLLPSNLHLGLEAMFDQFRAERARAFQALTKQFRSTAYEQQMSKLTTLFSEAGAIQPGPNAARGAYDYACALIWKRYRKVCKLARRITEDTPDEAVHALRIDCKKLRYLMEFFAPLFDKKAFKVLIKPLKKLQDNLGLFNDYSVQQDALLGFVSRQSNAQGRVNAQLALAAGGLVGILDQRQRAERHRVIASFKHFDSQDTQHLFCTLFHHKEVKT